MGIKCESVDVSEATETDEVWIHYYGILREQYTHIIFLSIEQQQAGNNKKWMNVYIMKNWTNGVCVVYKYMRTERKRVEMCVYMLLLLLSMKKKIYIYERVNVIHVFISYFWE